MINIDNFDRYFVHAYSTFFLPFFSFERESKFLYIYNLQESLENNFEIRLKSLFPLKNRIHLKSLFFQNILFL